LLRMQRRCSAWAGSISTTCLRRDGLRAGRCLAAGSSPCKQSRHTGETTRASEVGVQATNDTSQLLTVPECAALMRLKPSTVRAWILHRKIAHVKLGSRVFLRRSDCDALLAASLVPAREDRHA